MGTFANRSGRNIRNTNDDTRATTMTSSDATTRTMTALAGLLTVALATALATAALAEQAAPSAAPPAEAGMRVHVDPATGRMLETPAADPAQRRAADRAPLQEQDGATPQGGKMVVLDDRFHSEMRVEVPKDGKASTDCAPAPAR